jgi:hypothetical protein
MDRGFHDPCRPDERRETSDIVVDGEGDAHPGIRRPR